MTHTALPGGAELIFDERRAVATVRLDRPQIRNAQTVATRALESCATAVPYEAELKRLLAHGATSDAADRLPVERAAQVPMLRRISGTSA